MNTELITTYENVDNEIFQPIPENKILALIEERNHKKKLLQDLYQDVTGESRESVVDYFLQGTRASSVYNLFNLDRAYKNLDVDYWWKALRLTDIYDLMPQHRKNEWDNQLEGEDMPPFTRGVVIPTLSGLLAERPKFMAEKVDGIFQALSSEHLTNSPWGFGKRMIVAGVTDQYTFTCNRQCGHINDLRDVIATLMGRDKPYYGSTRFVISTLRQETGKWFELDGGSIKLRVYKKGTCHIEVHPDMAWKLNAILAHLHPKAIPSEHRKPPEKKETEVVLQKDLIPFEVIAALEGMLKKATSSRTYPEGFDFSLYYGGWSDGDKHFKQRVREVVHAIGGVIKGNQAMFDYDARPVIEHITFTGMLPEQKSHQYYPTPSQLAQEAVRFADIEEGHNVLEPSAGTGNLADFLPEDVDVIEISPLFQEVLKARGYNVVDSDFLEMKTTKRWDRIVMNPPFSEGRWKAHVEKAVTLLHKKGILVAVVPESAKNSLHLEGISDMEWSEEAFTFDGVSIKVVLLKVTK